MHLDLGFLARVSVQDYIHVKSYPYNCCICLNIDLFQSYLKLKRTLHDHIIINQVLTIWAIFIYLFIKQRTQHELNHFFFINREEGIGLSKGVKQGTGSHHYGKVFNVAFDCYIPRLKSYVLKCNEQLLKTEQN